MSDERPYTKRELDHQFGDMKNTLGLVLEQVQKTNGRVNGHDDKISVQSKMLYGAAGAIPLLTAWAWWLTAGYLDSRDSITNVQRLEIQAAVNTGISQALQGAIDDLKETNNR